jgi:hypothetical protein
LSTNKFSGKLEAVFADGDGGVKIVYGWCDDGLNFTYYDGEVIYLR